MRTSNIMPECLPNIIRHKIRSNALGSITTLIRTTEPELRKQTKGDYLQHSKDSKGHSIPAYNSTPTAEKKNVGPYKRHGSATIHHVSETI